MQSPPQLTDLRALRRNRRRVRPDALFLHETAAVEIKERLEEVNRTFTSMALVTGHPDFWNAHFPDAKLIGDDETLDLQPDAHDLIVHAMALHWANDPVGQLVQCRQSLRPDGLFLGVLFGGNTLNELRASLAATEAELTGGLSPRVAPMAEIRDLGGLLGRAGLALPVADTIAMDVTYADAKALARDLRTMGEANALVTRRRAPVSRRFFERLQEIYAGAYPAVDDLQRIRATFELSFLTGWAPDDTQQKPLRPGSASTRLADALGTAETSLKPGRD